MKCEKCGKDINFIITSEFMFDGTDRDDAKKIHEEYDAVYFEVSENWTGLELDGEEQRERIECPFCKQFPLKDEVIEVYQFYKVVMFKEDETDEMR